jgi:hypothetical protein
LREHSHRRGLEKKAKVIVTKWKELPPAPANVQPVVSGKKPWH